MLLSRLERVEAHRMHPWCQPCPKLVQYQRRAPTSTVYLGRTLAGAQSNWMFVVDDPTGKRERERAALQTDAFRWCKWQIGTDPQI